LAWTHPFEPKHKLTTKNRNAASLRREERMLAKLKYELESLELEIQQWGNNLYSLIPNKGEEVG